MKPRLIRDAEKTLPKKSFRCKIGLHDYQEHISEDYSVLKTCLRCKRTLIFLGHAGWMDRETFHNRVKLAKEISKKEWP